MRRIPLRPRRLPLPRNWVEWALAVACAAVIAAAISSLGSSSGASSPTRRTATVGRGVVQSTVSGNGSLEPAQQVELSFGASGEVTAIYVKAGQKVEKGEVLARVDSSAARASLASAQAQLSESEEALLSAEEAEEVETAYEYEAAATAVLADYKLEEGEAAGSGDGEAKTGPGEGTEAEEAEPEQAEPKEAEPEKSEPEEAKSTEAEAHPEPSGSESSGGSAAAAESSGESSGGAAQSAESVATAEANLREAELSVKSARQEVRETTLRAPISGTVASLSGAVGETVSGEGGGSGGAETSAAGAAVGGAETSSSSSSSSAFVVLAQLHRLKMEVSFSESDIGKVKAGQAATVAIDSMEGTELAGRVLKVSVLPSESSSGVVEYPATILLTQSAKGLRAGMSASAEVVVEEVKNALSVTSEAIASGPSKTVTVEEGGKEVAKTVTTGLVGDETTQIVSGLKAGETVVLPEATVATAGGEGETGATSAKEGGGFPFAGAGFSGTGGPPAGGFPGAR